MTVAVGLVCGSGVLVASDSMGTHGRLATPITKVFAFKNIAAVWTFAGSHYIAQEIEENLRELDDEWGSDAAWTALDPTEVKRAIRSRIGPIVKDAFESTTVPPGAKRVDHSTDFMFACWKEGSPGFLIRVHPDLATHISPESFAAIGYGHEYATVARALMGHHQQQTPRLHQGQLLAHRTISTVCEVSSGGVGLPVQVAVVDAQGARVLQVGEVEAISVAVDRWKQLERETLEIGGQDFADQGVTSDLPGFHIHEANGTLGGS